MPLCSCFLFLLNVSLFSLHKMKPLKWYKVFASTNKLLYIFLEQVWDKMTTSMVDVLTKSTHFKTFFVKNSSAVCLFKINNEWRIFYTQRTDPLSYHDFYIHEKVKFCIVFWAKILSPCIIRWLFKLITKKNYIIKEK